MTCLFSRRQITLGIVLLFAFGAIGCERSSEEERPSEAVDEATASEDHEEDDQDEIDDEQDEQALESDREEDEAKPFEEFSDEEIMAYLIANLRNGDVLDLEPHFWINTSERSSTRYAAFIFEIDGFFEDLRVLNIVGVDIKEEEILPVLENTDFSKLERLALGRWGTFRWFDQAMEIIIESGQMTNLVDLRIDSITLSDEMVDKFIAWEQTAELQSLELNGVQISPEAFEKLLESGALANVETLRFSEADLLDESFAALWTTESLANLSKLTVQRPRRTDGRDFIEMMRALAERFPEAMKSEKREEATPRRAAPHITCPQGDEFLPVTIRFGSPFLFNEHISERPPESVPRPLTAKELEELDDPLTEKPIWLFPEDDGAPCELQAGHTMAVADSHGHRYGDPKTYVGTALTGACPFLADRNPRSNIVFYAVQAEEMPSQCRIEVEPDSVHRSILKSETPPYELRHFDLDWECEDIDCHYAWQITAMPVGSDREVAYLEAVSYAAPEDEERCGEELKSDHSKIFVVENDDARELSELPVIQAQLLRLTNGEDTAMLGLRDRTGFTDGARGGTDTNWVSTLDLDEFSASPRREWRIDFQATEETLLGFAANFMCK